MKIITLGTSHGACEKNRFCSGTLLLTNGAAYLFDCGGAVEGTMTNLDIPTHIIKATFISHMHEDHVGTLSSIAKKFAIYHNSFKTKFFLPEENGVEGFKNWLKTIHIPLNDALSFGTVKEGKVYEDENISVCAIPTMHIAGVPTFAYEVECEGKKIIYTGDLTNDFGDFPKVAFEENFDLIISEFTHCSIQTMLNVVGQSKTKKVIFTHIYPHDEAPVLEATKKMPFDVTFAKDGQEFNI